MHLKQKYNLNISVHYITLQTCLLPPMTPLIKKQDPSINDVMYAGAVGFLELSRGIGSHIW